MSCKETKYSLCYAANSYLSTADLTLPKKMCEIKDPQDYVTLLTDQQTQIGIAEIRGFRETQEDAVAIDASATIQLFKTLSKSQHHHVYESTLNHMQVQYGQYKTTGSTVCVATAWRDEHTIYVSTANLGDSAAYIIVLDENHNIAIATRINTLHNPSPEFPDYDRIIKMGYKPYKDGLWRLPSGLAVSRALGDLSSESCGLIHTPETTYDTYPFEKRCAAFLVVACDGLTEQNILNAEKIGHVIKQYCFETPDKIALALVNAAYDHASGVGSTDNISAIVFPIQEQAISTAVLDGHGGNQVSKTVSQHLYSTISHHLIDLVKNKIQN